jgi:Rad3-related DNA helicase
MSATIFGAEYWGERLGRDPEYIEVPSTFPPSKRPIHIMPLMKVSAKVLQDPVARRKLVEEVDRIIKWHLPEKGLIHTTSYQLCDIIMTESMFARSGLLIRGGLGAVEKFKESEVGVLVSPRDTEGLDLPDDLCRFIIFPKIPYANLGDPLVRMRMEFIPGSYEFDAMTKIIQGCGRAVRHDLDYARAYILDSMWIPLYKKTYNMLPGWFKAAVTGRRYPKENEIGNRIQTRR